MHNKEPKQYLLRNIHNNRLTRWLVSRANRHLHKINSRYRLVIRYRTPTHSKYRNTFGDVKQKHATRFAIYLQDSPAYSRVLAERQRSTARQLEQHYNRPTIQ